MSKLVQNFKEPYFLLGGRTDIIFDTCFVTFKCTFYRMQFYCFGQYKKEVFDNLKVKSNLKLNGLSKFYELFKDSSFSRAFVCK